MFTILYRNILLIIAAVLMVGSVVLVAVLGLRPGIDFTGGSLAEVVYSGTVPDKATLESAVASLNIGSFSVRESVNGEGPDSYLIRTVALGEEERTKLTSAVTSLAENSEVTRFTSVGPVVGAELEQKAIWAIGGVILIIVLYVAYAFSGIGKPVSAWVYSSITIFVLLHDILIPTAAMSLLGYYFGTEADVLFVMAILAILGYSVNDTIVIFDRVRENLIKNRTERKIRHKEAGVVVEEVEYTLTAPYEELTGQAVEQSIARSINTSFTTMLSLIVLYLVGGEATRTFALVLLVGVLAGTYSSIFIANPLLVAYAKWREAK